MLPVEFVVRGVPKSAQSRSPKDVWKQKVRRAAAVAVPTGATPTTVDVMLRVVFYFDGKTNLDVDNIVKPISDALNGMVYVDDRQVTDVYAARRDLNAPFRVAAVSPALAAGLAFGSDFVHVRVEPAPDPRDPL